MDTRTRGGTGRELRLSRRPPRLFLVTSDEVVEDPSFLARAATAVAACGRGCALQLRAHRASGGRLWTLARELKVACAAAAATLWVNDRLDLALVARAHGVQLGAWSMGIAEARRLLGTACWIGASVHSPAESALAMRNDADLAVLGNIYPTPSHPDREPMGLGAVRQAALAGRGRRGARPIVAIGGITPQRVWEVMEAGAWGVAVLSGVWRAEDAGAAVWRYREALEDAIARTRGRDAE